MTFPWGGVGCCLAAAALYLSGKYCAGSADELRSVTRVCSLKDLSILLDTACGALPLVVAISGRVGSKRPIKCKRSDLKGVIVEETAEQHFLKRNEEDGKWKRESALMLSTREEVPWYLEDGTGYAVYVRGARRASGLTLTVASKVFEQPGRCLVNGTLDYVEGLKMLGVTRTECILPTGDYLTVVGEAVKNNAGKIHIRQPREGPFYVSYTRIDELISDLGNRACFYHRASMGFAIFGFYLLAKHAIQYILERRRCWYLKTDYAIQYILEKRRCWYLKTEHAIQYILERRRCWYLRTEGAIQYILERRRCWCLKMKKRMRLVLQTTMDWLGDC